MSIYIKLLRPRHWLKNILLFAAPLFGGRILSSDTLSMAVPAFISFCLCTSAAYIYNDIKDLEKDRLHPEKRHRPIASGGINIKGAITLAVLLATASLITAYIIRPLFFYYVLSYLSIQIAYSTYLKRIVIVDIFCIALGFVIRVLAGGTAFNTEVSHWLMLTMFMISLVLASGKRLGEASLLNDRAQGHRSTLDHYSISTLKEILVISSSASLVSYALYSIEQFPVFIYTLPVVTFGLFRYIHISKKGLGDPTEALTRDRPLILTVILWLLIVILTRYNRW